VDNEDRKRDATQKLAQEQQRNMEAIGKELIFVNLGARVHLISCLGLVYIPNSSSLLVQTAALLKLHGFFKTVTI